MLLGGNGFREDFKLVRFENRLADSLLHDLVCHVRVEGRLEENGIEKTGCWHVCQFTIHLAAVVHHTMLLRKQERGMAEQVALNIPGGTVKRQAAPSLSYKPLSRPWRGDGDEVEGGGGADGPGVEDDDGEGLDDEGGLLDMPAENMAPELLRLLGRHEEADAAARLASGPLGAGEKGWEPPAQSGLSNSDPLVRTSESSGGATNGTTLTSVTNDESQLGVTGLSGPFVPMGF